MLRCMGASVGGAWTGWIAEDRESGELFAVSDVRGVAFEPGQLVRRELSGEVFRVLDAEGRFEGPLRDCVVRRGGHVSRVRPSLE